MPEKTKVPTMKDVAAEAGVALGTVSKVFNGIPVGDDYRQKVEAAAKKLGYQVNAYARALKTNKTNTVALILPTIHHPFFSAFAQYCGKALQQRDYTLMLATSDYDTNAENNCISLVQQNKVAGIICLSYNPDFEVLGDIPFVSFDRYYGEGIPCVCSDNFGGGQLAASKLVENGCRKLLMLHEGSDVRGEPDKRELGFETYCKNHGIDYDMLIFHADHDWNNFWIYLDDHITDGRLAYDGIFCGTDQLAYKTVLHLRTRGISVPDDVQVIGFDGVRKFGTEDYYCSTIVQPIEEIANKCVELLLSDQKPAFAPLICLPVSYAYGGTTRDGSFVSHDCP